MNIKDLDYIKENHKWHFKWTDVFDRYIVLVLPLFFIFLSFVISYFSIKNDTDISFLEIALPIFLLGAILFYLILRRLNSESQFKVIPIQIKDNGEIKKYFDKIGWTFSLQNDNVIVGITSLSFFSLSDQITIVVEEKQLLFNSIPYGRQAFSINRDKINYKKLYNALMT